ncbi:MAG: hypothetical protein KAT68_13070 [Bacteroidales bacterium]|nr:hypothetical protein [Bacteroidales bacterium]
MNNKTFKQYIKKLQSDNSSDIENTIEKIRINGNCHIIPEIINVIKFSTNEEVRNKSIRLLNDIKDKNAVPYIIDAIKDKENKQVIDIITSSCWQNGLDFSNYYSVFIDLIVNENYNTSLEAFTVIEEIIKNVNYEERNKSILKLKKKLKKIDADKQKLINELILLLEKEK